MGIGVLWSSEVKRRFPELALGYAVVRGVVVGPRDDELDSFVRSREQELRSRYSLDRLKDVPLVRVYRDLFWRLGIDPTKKRPAAEALLRRVLRGSGLPSISNVVDAYNIASVETLVTMSAYDLARVSPPLEIRFARRGEEAILIGGRVWRASGGELVLADRLGMLCVYVHGDAERSKVSGSTKEVLLVAYGAPGVESGYLRLALEKAVNYVTRFAGGVVGEIGVSECRGP